AASDGGGVDVDGPAVGADRRGGRAGCTAAGAEGRNLVAERLAAGTDRGGGLTHRHRAAAAGEALVAVGQGRGGGVGQADLGGGRRQCRQRKRGGQSQ